MMCVLIAESGQPFDEISCYSKNTVTSKKNNMNYGLIKNFYLILNSLI